MSIFTFMSPLVALSLVRALPAQPDQSSSTTVLFCYHLCGLKQRRDGGHPWVGEHNLCTCWDSPGSDDVHSYQVENCHPPKAEEYVDVSSGQRQTCDRRTCSGYLEAENIAETAVADNAFVCAFKLAGKFTYFCLCDFKYSSALDNFVGGTEMMARKWRVGSK